MNSDHSSTPQSNPTLDHWPPSSSGQGTSSATPQPYVAAPAHTYAPAELTTPHHDPRLQPAIVHAPYGVPFTPGAVSQAGWSTQPAAVHAPYGMSMAPGAVPQAEWLPAQLPPVQTDLHGGLPISYHSVAGLGNEWAWNMGNVYGQPPVLYPQPRLAPMPCHTPMSYDPSVAGRWTSPRGLAMEASSPSMLPTEQPRLW